jgi:hypothetical protein
MILNLLPGAWDTLKKTWYLIIKESLCFIKLNYLNNQNSPLLFGFSIDSYHVEKHP